MKTWTLEIDEKKRYDHMTGEPKTDTDYIIRDSDKNLVTLVYPYGKSPYVDSHIIAAAPDMLEALEEIRQRLKDEDDCWKYEMTFALIENAISKAKGELCK
jgi:hypothetical protein